MLGQHVKMALGRKARCLTGFRIQVEHERAPRRRRFQCGEQSRHQHVRDHAGEPGARSEHHEVGRQDRVHGLPGGRWVPGHQPHPAHLPRRGGHRDLTADHPAHPGIGFQSGDVGLDLQRERAHRQHPPLDAEDPPEFVECGDRVGQHLAEAGEQQVADRMTRQRAVAAEPVLDDGGPQPAVRAVRGQRRQRHSQITRRDDIEFGAQPPGRAAVVGHRDDGGDVRGEPAGGGQGGVEPVAAAESDDARGGVRVQRPHRPGHSRPRSRCSTRTVSCSLAASKSASASAIATLRCLPPVHPIATVMYRLPSRA